MSTATDEDLPPHPAQVIYDNKEEFEKVAENAEDPSIRRAFGEAPLEYMEEHWEQVDTDGGDSDER